MTNKHNWREVVRRNIGDGVPAPYRKTVRKALSSRAAAISYLEDTGGYSYRYEKFPLAWSAKCYGSDLSLNAMYEHGASDEFGWKRGKARNAGERGVIFDLFYKVWHPHRDHLWEMATADAWESFKDDESTFWGDGMLSRSWGLYGRSAGNLVLHEVDGQRLRGSNEDLIKRLQERENGDVGPYVEDHDWVVKLTLVVIQHDIDWGNSKDRDREIEYRAAWSLWSMLDEKDIDNALEAYREAHPET